MHASRHPVTQTEVDAFINAMPIVILARALYAGFLTIQRAAGFGKVGAKTA